MYDRCDGNRTDIEVLDDLVDIRLAHCVMEAIPKGHRLVLALSRWIPMPDALEMTLHHLGDATEDDEGYFTLKTRGGLYLGKIPRDIRNQVIMYVAERECLSVKAARALGDEDLMFRVFTQGDTALMLAEHIIESLANALRDAISGEQRS